MGLITMIKNILTKISGVIAGLVCLTGLATADTRPSMNPSATIRPIDLTLYNNSTAAIFGNGNWYNVTIEGVVGSIFQPYVNALGPMAFVMVVGVLGLLMYIKTESVLLPGLLLAANGILFIWWLPYEWQYVSYGFVIIGVTISIMSIVLKRR